MKRKRYLSEEDLDDSVYDSFWRSIVESVWGPVNGLVYFSIGDSVRKSVSDSVWVPVESLVWDSVRDSIGI